MLSPQKMRELVFHLLYSADFAPEHQDEITPFLMQHHLVSKKSVYSAHERFGMIQSHRETIDQMIAQTATEYEFERIPRVERNLLRLGIFELLFSEDVPPKVAISEAIRLARKFSSAESAHFINAILDTIYKKKSVHV